MTAIVRQKPRTKSGKKLAELLLYIIKSRPSIYDIYCQTEAQDEI
jgi:hypothetical protein